MTRRTLAWAVLAAFVLAVVAAVVVGCILEPLVVGITAAIVLTGAALGWAIAELVGG